MDKLTMAHEYALKMLENLNPMQMEKPTRDGIVYECFELADAMQAEADKRKSKPELPSLQQTFIDGVEQPRYAPPCEEWQPDWSQAPDNAEGWCMYEDGMFAWLYNAKYMDSSALIYSCEAPSFNYQGNWQDSLRKRPQ